MGRIVVDVDGVTLAELLTWSAITVTPFVLLMNLTGLSRAHATICGPYRHTLQYRTITEKDNAWLYSLSHQTSDFGNQNGFISQVADICYVPMRGLSGSAA